MGNTHSFILVFLLGTCVLDLSGWNWGPGLSAILTVPQLVSPPAWPGLEGTCQEINSILLLSLSCKL